MCQALSLTHVLFQLLSTINLLFKWGYINLFEFHIFKQCEKAKTLLQAEMVKHLDKWRPFPGVGERPKSKKVSPPPRTVKVREGARSTIHLCNPMQGPAHTRCSTFVRWEWILWNPIKVTQSMLQWLNSALKSAVTLHAYERWLPSHPTLPLLSPSPLLPFALPSSASLLFLEPIKQAQFIHLNTWPSRNAWNNSSRSNRQNPVIQVAYAGDTWSPWDSIKYYREK